MEKKVYELIDSYREEYIRTLRNWIRTPSVKGRAENGAPFGTDVRKMLDLAIRDAREMGFEVRDFDGYACDVTLGGAEEKIAVLGHLDVVPEGDGWTKPPFEGLIEDGRIYGRGTNDDKGPALASLFAMKAIRDAGIPLKKGIRLILGCDEESGWEDMEYYGSHERIPDVGFSPDATFPLINTEKGMMVLELRAPAADSGLKVLQVSAGDRVNVIPGECTALAEGGEELAEKVRAYAEKTGLPYTAEVTDRGVAAVYGGGDGPGRRDDGHGHSGTQRLSEGETERGRHDAPAAAGTGSGRSRRCAGGSSRPGTRRIKPRLRLPGRGIGGTDLQHGDPAPAGRGMVCYAGLPLPGHGGPGETEESGDCPPGGIHDQNRYAEAAASRAGGQRTGEEPAGSL